MAAEGNGNNSTTLADFIWNNAELLWGDFKHVEFGKILLPFTLLRRLECVLEPTREQVLTAADEYSKDDLDLELLLPSVSGFPFFNISSYHLGNLGATKTRQNLEDYVSKFSDNARRIFEQFDFIATIGRLDRAGLLYKLTQNFYKTDLHPSVVPDRVMSNVYEHLIRRFGASVNDQAEDFMTPRDVVRLATKIVLDDDVDFLERGVIRTIYDPTCGTGGFLSDAISMIQDMGRMDDSSSAPLTARLVPFGQELEPETHAVCMTSMMIQGFDVKNIKLGSTLSNDQLHGKRFHYCLANPPFGKKWEKDADAVNHEHKELGFAGRFGAGVPRINDGSMLFLQHLANKMELPERGGGRVGIVLSGSPLFNGGADSGESNIRRWLLENDYVDAIISLPTDIFFRTGIGTYLWLLSNKKPEHRRGKVQLINATEFYSPMRKSEGNKRRYISDEQADDILRIYEAFEDSEYSKVLSYTAFGYRRITVERPLRMRFEVTPEALQAYSESKGSIHAELFATVQGTYKDIHLFMKAAGVKKLTAAAHKAVLACFGAKDPTAEEVLNMHGEVMADTELRDFENVPLGVDVQDYFEQEVLPHLPDAWIDETRVDKQDGEVGIVGYEINFNRYFYKYVAPRKLEDIDLDLKKIEAEIAELLGEVTE